MAVNFTRPQTFYSSDIVICSTSELEEHLLQLSTCFARFFHCNPYAVYYANVICLLFHLFLKKTKVGAAAGSYSSQTYSCRNRPYRGE